MPRIPPPAISNLGDDDSLTYVEELLRRSEEQPEYIGVFLLDLMKSDVVVLANLGSEGYLRFESLSETAEPEGGNEVPRPPSLSFFSSPQFLIRSLAANHRSFVMNAEEFLRTTRGCHLHLNPGTHLSMELTPDLVEAMLETRDQSSRKTAAEHR